MNPKTIKKWQTINCEAAVNLGLVEKGFDYQYAAILDFIHWRQASTKSEKIVEGNRVYVWVSKQDILDRLPLLGIGTPRGIAKRIQGLKKMGLIDLHEGNQSKRKSYYSLTPLAEKMWEDDMNETRNESSKLVDSLGTKVPLTRNESSKSLGTKVPRIDRDKERDKKEGGVNLFQKFLLAFQVQQNANLSTAWVKLSDQDKQLIATHLPEYMKRTAPKGADSPLTWRKSPLNYLKGREWLNPLPVVQDQTLIDPTVLPKEKTGGKVVPSNGVRYV